MEYKKSVLEPKITDNFGDKTLAKDALLYFCNSPLFYDNDNRYEENFYGRRIRPHVLKHINFDEPLELKDMLSYSSFAANRVLFSMNDTSFLYLPTKSDLCYTDFNEFYDDKKLAAAGVAIPYLENYLFSFLDEEIKVSDNWNLKLVEDYFNDYINAMYKQKTMDSAESIKNSIDKKNAAQDWLLQLAPDFLIESSPMARYSSGNYGEMGSALFRIIIDELGYGDHKQRHSTLFEKTLESADLNNVPHYYWQYYLNTSLLLANYYNMITRNKRNIFRYIGAIFLAETSFIVSCKIWLETLKDGLPDMFENYFKEHCHIDTHHSKTAFDDLVKPAIEKYGTTAAVEIVRGFEEARFLGELAEKDFADQIEWKDKASYYKNAHDVIFSKVKEGCNSGKVTVGRFVEPRGELSITHTHDNDELCHIVSGEMEFLNGFGKSTILKANEGTIIKANRLHGALITSDECEYEIYSIGDLNQWL
ncbi:MULTISPECIES: iron-containing redox enzyme family protein [Bacillus]|uniref:iron-containing redox enzyme family protein n=1 Tax=Bacillus TaxID=1386 RepID=UPI000BEB51A2|nr:iron-containing redox enzyme family protein [Bacillus wiedmannii]PDZ45257.1 cupin [Bacillus wiedmannii]